MNNSKKDKTYIVVDIETTPITPLLKDIDTIFCIALKPLGGETKCYTYKHTSYSDGTLEEALNIINEYDYVIGHNFIKFDKPVIENLLGKLKPKVIDTLIDAKLTVSKDGLLARDMNRPNLPKKLIGSYSLKAFGYRMNFHKLEFEDFSELTEEMVIYCKQDVEVTEKLYLTLSSNKYYPSESIRELEYEVARIIKEQEEFGCYFNYEGARDYALRLQFSINNIDRKLTKIFPPMFVADGEPQLPNPRSPRRVREVVTKLDALRNLRYHVWYPRISKQRKWIFPKNIKYKPYPHRLIYYKATGEFQNIKLQVLNPSSRQQLMQRLERKFGWTPSSYTSKGSPKLDYETLEELSNDNR